MNFRSRQRRHKRTPSQITLALFALRRAATAIGCVEVPKLRFVFASDHDRFVFEKAVLQSFDPSTIAFNPNVDSSRNRFELAGIKFALLTLLTEDR